VVGLGDDKWIEINYDNLYDNQLKLTFFLFLGFDNTFPDRSVLVL